MAPTAKKQKLSVKREYEVDTDDEEEGHGNNSDTSRSHLERDNAEKGQEWEQYLKEWNEKWGEGKREDRMKDIVKRKKALNAGKREKETYVWHLCTKHPDAYATMWNAFGVAERGILLVLPKERYELWHEILENLDSCLTWGDVRDLGEDVYREVVSRYERISENGERPTLATRFDMTKIDVSGTYGNDTNDDIDVQDQQFPNDMRKIMFDELPYWMAREYNTFYSQFAWNSDILGFDSKDVDLLLEDIVLGGDSIEHEPGLEDFAEHQLRIDGYLT